MPSRKFQTNVNELQNIPAINVETKFVSIFRSSSIWLKLILAILILVTICAAAVVPTVLLTRVFTTSTTTTTVSTTNSNSSSSSSTTVASTTTLATTVISMIGRIFPTFYILLFRLVSQRQPSARVVRLSVQPMFVTIGQVTRCSLRVIMELNVSISIVLKRYRILLPLSTF